MVNPCEGYTFSNECNNAFCKWNRFSTYGNGDMPGHPGMTVIYMRQHLSELDAPVVGLFTSYFYT